jgi:hypothetical protein
LGHKRSSVKRSLVHGAFTNLFEQIKFTPDFLEILEKTLIWQFRKREGEFSDINSKANQNVADLHARKSQLIKAFGNATLTEVQQSLEQEIKDITEQIGKATIVRNENELKEKDITDFITWCKRIMEHPYKILEDIRTPDEQRELFSLFFEENPTYSDLVNGTPKMTFVFKVNSDFLTNKSDIAVYSGMVPVGSTLVRVF